MQSTTYNFIFLQTNVASAINATTHTAKNDDARDTYLEQVHNSRVEISEFICSSCWCSRCIKPDDDFLECLALYLGGVFHITFINCVCFQMWDFHICFIGYPMFTAFVGQRFE